MRGAANSTGEARSAAEANSCRRKKRYKSRKLALRTREDIFERFATRTSPYHCSFCGGWHLFSRKV